MYKNNGEYSDHRKIYGKGYYDGLSEGKSDDGFGAGALLGAAVAGVGALIAGALSSDSSSDSYTIKCPRCKTKLSYNGGANKIRCCSCGKKIKL